MPAIAEPTAPATDPPTAAESSPPATTAEPGRNRLYHWPIWRFGQILAVAGEPGLSASKAIDIGKLFEPGARGTVRYLGERMATAAEQARQSDGDLVARADAGFAELVKGLPPRLLKRLQDQQALNGKLDVTYQFVPMVKFPPFFVRIAGATWICREGLTVCGWPSRSKLWLVMTLFRAAGQTTTETDPVSGDQILAARDRIENLKTALLESLLDYYRSVLAVDAPQEGVDVPVDIAQLGSQQSVEVFAVHAGATLGGPFDRLERDGLEQFLAASGEDPAAVPVVDFCNWVERVNDHAWTTGVAKMIDVYPQEDHFHPLRALIVPRHPVAGNGYIWYGSIAEHREEAGIALPSETVSSILAQEYGRCF